jgi:hypothetical protein
MQSRSRDLASSPLDLGRVALRLEEIAADIKAFKAFGYRRRRAELQFLMGYLTAIANLKKLEDEEALRDHISEMLFGVMPQLKVERLGA